MKNLIVSTLSPAHEAAAEAIGALVKANPDTEVIDTTGMDIRGCIGCNNCWLRTPGKCVIKDDYEQIFIKYLQVDRVIFVCDTKLGFVTYQMKNLVDRILPLALMYLKFQDGQMRHVSRYNKKLEFGMLYTGDGNREYLNEWMERFALNMLCPSLGAYKLEDEEGFIHAFGNHQLHA